MGGALDLYHTNLNGFKIIGEGMGIGSKARVLANAAPRLQEIGFTIPETVVLPEEYFNNYFQDNNIGASLREITPSPKIEQAVLNGSLSENYMRDLTVISNYYDWEPLAVRSSAEGDSRGTGRYLSDFCNNTPDNLGGAIKKVLASYFSYSAMQYRQIANTGEGFGIMIQKMHGERLNDGKNYAPTLSGHGYINTTVQEEYIAVVPFLGGGVNTGEYLKLNIRELGSDRSFFDLAERKEKLFFDYIIKGESFSLENNITEYNNLEYSGQTDKAMRRTMDTEIKNIFQPIIDLKNDHKKPMYIEWAYADGQLSILQTSDIEEVQYVIPQVKGLIDLNPKHVVNSGKKVCLHPWDFGGERPYFGDLLNRIKEINKYSSDYMLIIPSSLLTSGGLKFPFTYEHYSRASVIIEVADINHAQNPISHFVGGLDGKLYAMITTDMHRKIRAKLEKNCLINENYLEVYADQKAKQFFIKFVKR